MLQFSIDNSSDLCNAADELAPEQKEEELLPILVQQLYVLNTLGKTEEAESLLKILSIER